MKKLKTVNEYFASLPKNVRTPLEKIRRLVKQEVPEAQELLSYQMPAFKVHGRILIYYSAWKEHIGLYPPVPKIFKKEVARYAGPKGNLKFSLDKPIPLALVKRIIRYKTKENLERLRVRKK